MGWYVFMADDEVGHRLFRSDYGRRGLGKDGQLAGSRRFMFCNSKRRESSARRKCLVKMESFCTGEWGKSASQPVETWES